MRQIWIKSILKIRSVSSIIHIVKNQNTSRLTKREILRKCCSSTISRFFVCTEKEKRNLWTRKINWARCPSAHCEYARGLAVVKSFGRDIPLEHFDIAFDHVSFGYDDRQVLHDVSFTIPAGKSFGILGGTGSGKSSLLLLLCRLYAPSEGRVTVGGATVFVLEVSQFLKV